MWGVLASVLNLALGCVSLTPESLHASTITARSCSSNDVETAVNSAVNGDTVLIPAGHCVWTSNVTIDGKRLTVEGAGVDKTIIVDGVSKDNFPNIPQVLIWNTIDGGISRLTGITFQGGSTKDVFNKGIVRFKGTSHQFRIDHCKFIPTQTHGLSIAGELWGVIDHNKFDLSAHHGYAIYVFGISYGDIAWSEGSTLGTERNVFVEDNFITQDQALGVYEFGIDGWSGSRVVIRHNHFNNTLVANHGTESGGRSRSQRSWEIYGNAFTWNMQNKGYPSLIDLRGGTGVIFNNNATVDNEKLGSFATYSHFRANKSYAPWGHCPSLWDLGADRCLDQIGVGRGDSLSGDSPKARWLNQVNDPAYDWNNKINGAVSSAVSKTPTVIKEKRDFFHTPKPGYTPFRYPHPLTALSEKPDPGPDSPQDLVIK